MAAGLGVLARLTQQVSENRVKEQNFRSDLGSRLRAEVTQNRKLRITEQSDLAAQNDRDLDRDQRDKRAAERIAQEDKAIAAANERSRISAASRVSGKLPAGGGLSPNNALFPGAFGGNTSVLEGQEEGFPRGDRKRPFNPNNPNTFLEDEVVTNIFETDKYPEGWSPNSDKDNQKLATSLAAQEAEIELIEGRISARGQHKASTVDARKSQSLTNRNAQIASLNTIDIERKASLLADNKILEGFGTFTAKPKKTGSSAGTLTNSQRLQLKTGIAGMEPGQKSIIFVNGVGTKSFIPKSTAQDLLREDTAARGGNSPDTGDLPGTKVDAPGINPNDPTGIEATNDPNNPPGTGKAEGRKSTNKRNQILDQLKPKTSFNIPRSRIGNPSVDDLIADLSVDFDGLGTTI